MSAAPGDERLRRGEARLTRELDRLRRRLEDSVAGVTRELEEEVSGPLQTALAAARDAHEALLRETGMDVVLHPLATTAPTPSTGRSAGEPEGDAGQGDRQDGSRTDRPDDDMEGGSPRLEDPAAYRDLPPWKTLSAYRRGLGVQVLEPLDEALARIRPSSALQDRWLRFQKRLGELHRGCPVHVDRPEPSGLYRPDQGDGPLVTTGKLAVGAARGLRRAVAAPFRGLATLAGAPPAPRSVPLQRVRLKALARDWLRGPEPLTWTEVGEDLWQHHARPLAELERALTVFNRSWYPLEASRQTATDILDETLARRLAHIMAQAAEVPGEPSSGRADGEDRLTEADDAEVEGTTDNTEPGQESGDPALEKDGGVGVAGSQVPTESADEASTDGESGDEGPTDGETFLRLVETIEALQSALSRAADCALPDELKSRIRHEEERTWARFVDAVDRSDSFHAPSTPRDRDFERAAARYESRGRRWHPWYAGARARIHFAVLLTRIRKHWDDAEGRLVNEIGRQGLVDLADEWLDARDHLLILHREAVASPELTPEAIRERPGEVAETLDRWLETATRELQEHLVEPLDRHQAVEAIARIADEASESLSRSASRLPESVELNLPQTDPSSHVVPGVSRRTVGIRGLVSETLDAFRVEAIRTSPTPLLAVLEQAAVEAAEIPRVVEYNLTAAREELLSERSEEPLATAEGNDGDQAGRSELAGAERPGPVSGDSGAKGSPERTPTGEESTAAGSTWEEEVEELTLQGLARTAQGVEALLSVFGPAWQEFITTVHATLPPTFQEFHGRAVAEGMVREQIHGLQAFLRRQRRMGWKEIRSVAGDLAHQLQKRWRRLRVRLRSLLRLGRMAVGASADGADEERALEILRTIPELVAPLPLVYRRLFSFQPVTDATLLAGREEELKWLAERHAGWMADRPAASMVVAAPGSGVSSLFNVLDSEVLKDSGTARIEFNERRTDEETLASEMAAALCVTEFSGSLRDLGSRIMAGDAPPGCRTVLLEGLEYLHFRGPDGGRLLADLMAFQAHTASRIFWVSSISQAAWSLVKVRSPVAASMVSVLELKPLTREQVATSILQRHRRSGLPLVFLPPTDLNPLKARALKRARSQEERQTILEEDFFDRIYRLSKASPAMADVLWLRSLDMESGQEHVQVRACRPVRFAFLETLTPEMDFALMALLEHGSLTPEECGDVLQLPDQAVLGIFEALRSRMLLQDVVDEHTIPRPVGELETDASYRIPRILGMAVAERLRGLNILH